MTIDSNYVWYVARYYKYIHELFAESQT